MMLVLIALSRSADCMAYTEGRALELEETREDRVTGKSRKGRGDERRGDATRLKRRGGTERGQAQSASLLHYI